MKQFDFDFLHPSMGSAASFYPLPHTLSHSDITKGRTLWDVTNAEKHELSHFRTAVYCLIHELLAVP